MKWPIAIQNKRSCTCCVRWLSQFGFGCNEIYHPQCSVPWVIYSIAASMPCDNLYLHVILSFCWVLAVCNCNSLGSLSAVCNTSGQCFCKPAVEGEKCDRCIPDHYNFESGQGCRSCDCHVQGSLTSQCDLVTGVCQCKPGVEGAKCDRCMVGYYGLDEDGCK